MSSRRHSTQSLIMFFMMAIIGCNAPPDIASNNGQARLMVRGLTDVSSVVATAEPSGIHTTLIFDRTTKEFRGNLVLPEGEATITATAYGSDPNNGAVGSGSAKITITPNTSTPLILRIYDETPQSTQPNIRPIIRSVWASSSTTEINKPITFTADAVDLDNDLITYNWSSSCVGVFTTPHEASTSWTPTAAAACSVTLVLKSVNSTFTENFEIIVYGSGGSGPTGAINIQGQFVGRPLINRIEINDYGHGHNYNSDINREYGNNANFRNIPADSIYSITASIDFTGWHQSASASINSDCGGVLQAVSTCAPTPTSPYCHISYSWTSPSAGTVCKITATASVTDGSVTLTDTFNGGVLVIPRTAP
jgi:hypothetical protein